MNTLLNKLIQTGTSYAPLALRIPVGIIFIAHGTQKLFGWDGMGGLQATGQLMVLWGLEPGVLMAFLAGCGELLGGLLLLIGLLTRPAALLTAFMMIVAILAVHIDNGLFVINNGYEFGLALVATSASLLISGAGNLSVDRLLSKKSAE